MNQNQNQNQIQIQNQSQAQPQPLTQKISKDKKIQISTKKESIKIDTKNIKSTTSIKSGIVENQLVIDQKTNVIEDTRFFQQTAPIIDVYLVSIFKWRVKQETLIKILIFM